MRETESMRHSDGSRLTVRGFYPRRPGPGGRPGAGLLAQGPRDRFDGLVDLPLVQARKPEIPVPRPVVDHEAPAVELDDPLVLDDQAPGEVVLLAAGLDRRPGLAHQVFELVRRQRQSGLLVS